MAARRLIETSLPLVGAPMAGGPTTVELGRAVAAAGGFAFAAAGYKPADAFAADLTAWDGLGVAYGVNLFVPDPERRVDPEAFARYAEALAPEAAAVGVELNPVPHWDDDAWSDKVALVLEHRVPVVSFTFGLPPAADAAALHDAGIVLLGSVTTVDEARRAVAAGMDGLVLQGPGAGGHSATFDPLRPITDVPLVQLLGEVLATVDVPVIACGGVDGSAAVRELLDAGAEAVAVGTLLLSADEAGTSATHRETLRALHFDHTVITHAFTGRPARGLRNGFIDRHENAAPYGYPEIHHLTRDLRRAASTEGDPDRLHLWAGTGYRKARSAPAAELIGDLAADL